MKYKRTKRHHENQFKTVQVAKTWAENNNFSSYEIVDSDNEDYPFFLALFNANSEFLGYA